MAMADNLIEVNGENFDAVRQENSKIVMDCWADWCGPCRMLSPIVEKLAKEYAGKVTFAKMDCDENQRLAQQLKIMAIPTLLFFKDGKVVDQIVGVVSKEEIEEVMGKHF